MGKGIWKFAQKCGEEMLVSVVGNRIAEAKERVDRPFAVSVTWADIAKSNIGSRDPDKRGGDWRNHPFNLALARGFLTSAAGVMLAPKGVEALGRRVFSPWVEVVTSDWPLADARPPHDVSVAVRADFRVFSYLIENPETVGAYLVSFYGSLPDAAGEACQRLNDGNLKLSEIPIEFEMEIDAGEFTPPTNPEDYDL